MNKQTFITSTTAKLKAKFPHLVFRLIVDPDDDATFFAYTFCVADGSEEATKTLVRTFLRNFLDDISAYDVIPAIKNLTTTKAYYPQYLRSVPRRHTVPNSVSMNNSDKLAKINYV